MRLLVDPITNSLKRHNKNCITVRRLADNTLGMIEFKQVAHQQYRYVVKDLLNYLLGLRENAKGLKYFQAIIVEVICVKWSSIHKN